MDDDAFAGGAGDDLQALNDQISVLQAALGASEGYTKYAINTSDLG